VTEKTPEKTPVEAAERIPVLPLRDVVVYPHMVIPLFVGREKSIVALDEAMNRDKRILLVAQKQADVDDPKPKDLYVVGTVATILQLLKLPDGTVKVLVEGVERAIVEDMEAGDYFAAEIAAMPDVETYDEREIDVLTRSVVAQFEQYVKLNKKVPPEILTSLAGIEQPGRLADTVAAHMALKLADKQKVLEIQDVRQRLEHILTLIEGEMEVLQIEKKIRSRVKSQMEKSQREYYLNEQMKAIQKELGESEEGGASEIAELEKRIAKAGMPKEAKAKATAELNKLKLMSPMSAEATVVRNYVDWLLKVPWKKRTKVHLDIAEAQKVLDEDHYGLDKVKERIVEYLAVQQRVKNLKGPILCLGSARPRLDSPLRAPPTASSCACRSVASATRPRSAATAAPTSGRCPARSCRTWPARACATRCSCSTKWTRCPWTSAATRPRRCSRCSTRSRTPPSPTITWRSTSTCPR
jgi:ATP-dependent Lon protease